MPFSEFEAPTSPAPGEQTRPLAYGLALSLLLLTVLVVALWADHDRKIEVASRRAAAIAQGSERLLTLEMRNLERALRGIARDSAALDAQTPEEARRLRLALVAGVDDRHVELQDVVLVDEHGQPIDAGDVAGDAGIGAWARDPRNRRRPEGLAIGLPHRDPRGQWLVPLAVPLGLGTKPGWVLAQLRQQTLAELTRGLDIGKAGVANVFDRRGRLLARSHGGAPQVVGADFSNTPLLRALLDGGHEGSSDLVSPVDDVRRLVAYRALDDYPLLVAVGVSRSEALGTWYGFAAATALVGLAYLLGWLLLGRTLWRANRRQSLLLARLAASRETLLEAQRIGGLGWYRLDLVSNVALLSPQAMNIYGFGPEDLPVSLADCLQRTHPEDREYVTAEHERHVRGNDFPDTRYRVQQPDGTVRMVIARGRIVGEPGSQTMVGTLQDITELTETMERLREAESQYRLLFERNPMPFWVFHRESFRMLEVNEAALTQYGYSREEFLSMHLRDLRPAEDIEEAERVAREGNPERRRGRIWRHLCRDGRMLWVSVHSADISFRGHPARLVLALDVTERLQAQQKLEQSEGRFQLVARATSDAVFDWDIVTGQVWRSQSFDKLFSYGAEEVPDNIDAWQERVHPDDRASVDAELHRFFYQSRESEWSAHYRFRRGDGEYAYVHDRGVLERDTRGKPLRMVGGMVDESRQHQNELELAYKASHDELTGLRNRAALLAGLERMIAQAGDAPLTLLYLDVNNFKLINDSLGHEVGDAVLQAVAERLRALVGSADRVGRMGGNEFLAVLPGHDTEAWIERVLDGLSQPIEALSTLHYLSLNAGIARYPEHGRNPILLLRNAGLATHEARRRGYNQRVEYNATFDRAVTDRQHLVSQLHEAMEREQFELHFQPLYSSRREPIGLEALIRWRHPERGLVPPSEFIPVAEDSGLIVPLGRWVLREACRHHRLLEEAGWGHLTIAVNVSAMQFLSGELQSDVPALLREFGVPHGVLELELTESLVMENPEPVIEVMRELRQYGVLLSIDDFGTGYSSMSYLHRLPVDKLKIDRSFVSQVETDSHNAAICESILALARSFDLKVIAEGVETQAQFDWLRAHHCDEVQGYLLARPMPFSDVVATLTMAHGRIASAR